LRKTRVAASRAGAQGRRRERVVERGLAGGGISFFWHFVE
jgi:hypothetical protein